MDREMNAAGFDSKMVLKFQKIEVLSEYSCGNSRGDYVGNRDINFSTFYIAECIYACGAMARGWN